MLQSLYRLPRHTRLACPSGRAAARCRDRIARMLVSGPGVALENMALTPQQRDMDICGRQLLWLLQNEEVVQQEIRDLVEDVISARYSRHDEILRQDVADDVLIKVRDWCAKNPETPIECLPAFIRAAAYRAFADIRRRGKLRSVGGDALGRISGNAARYASLSLELAVAFEMVPEPYRTAGSLKFFEGLTDQELADNLGVSLSVLQHRLARCRNVLRAVVLVEWAEDRMEAGRRTGQGADTRRWRGRGLAAWREGFGRRSKPERPRCVSVQNAVQVRHTPSRTILNAVRSDATAMTRYAGLARSRLIASLQLPWLCTA